MNMISHQKKLKFNKLFTQEFPSLPQLPPPHTRTPWSLLQLHQPQDPVLQLVPGHIGGLWSHIWQCHPFTPHDTFEGVDKDHSGAKSQS